MTTPDPNAATNRSATDTSWTGPTEALVQGIVAVLNAELPGDVHVDVMPDKIRDFDLGTSREAAALVHYRGSRYEKSMVSGMAAQQREPTLDVHLMVRGLAGRLGAHNLVDLTRLSLQGRSIAGLSGLNIVSDGLVTENDGIWDYALSFTGGMPAVSRRHPTPDRSAP